MQPVSRLPRFRAGGYADNILFSENMFFFCWLCRRLGNAVPKNMCAPCAGACPVQSVRLPLQDQTAGIPTSRTAAFCKQPEFRILPHYYSTIRKTMCNNTELFVSVLENVQRPHRAAPV